MATVSAHLTAALPIPTHQPHPRRFPLNAIAASVAPQRTARIALRDCSKCSPVARRFHGFENAISLRAEHNKHALFASDRDSPNNVAKESSSSYSSSSNGPPVLTILAGVVVFLLVICVLGSFVTWIVSLVFGAAKS